MHFARVRYRGMEVMVCTRKTNEGVAVAREGSPLVGNAGTHTMGMEYDHL